MPGLRREEVAVLAGVSTDWYTRLEKGHIAGVSEDVLEAVARALQLDEAERTYLFDLARAARPTRTPQRRGQGARSSRAVQWMLDSMTGSAAFVANGRLDIVATNTLGRALHSPLFDNPRRPANFARFQFLDPRARDYYPNWDGAANVTVALLRAEAGRHPHDTHLRELVGELSTVSEEFRTRWAAHNVRIHHNGAKQFHHPVVGALELAYCTLDLPAADSADLRADHLHRRARDAVRGRPQAAGQLGGDRRAARDPTPRPTGPEPGQRGRTCAHSSSRACTNACGRLPRSWRWATSNSSASSPGEPQAARVRSNQRNASDPLAGRVQREGQHEAAEQERALLLAQRGGVGPEPVHVAVLGELVQDGGQRRPAAGVGDRQRPAHRRQQQRGVGAGHRRAALPPARPGAGSGGWSRRATASARVSARAARAWWGGACAICRSPATTASRDCVHQSSVSSQMPASGLFHVCSTTSTASSAAASRRRPARRAGRRRRAAAALRRPRRAGTAG